MTDLDPTRGRVKGTLYGSLLLEQPRHRAVVDEILAFVDPPGSIAVEIGADTGAVLIDHARTFPAWRWIGLEIRRGRVQRAQPACPDNARLWALDARTVFATVVPPGRIDRIDVLFPTPAATPERRLFSPAFTADLARALGPDGVLTVATDVGWLWAEIEATLDGWAPTEAPPRGEARSRRERVCRREGLPVYGGSFRAPAR
jgi:tRNA G46 methylase TrmB